MTQIGPRDISMNDLGELHALMTRIQTIISNTEPTSDLFVADLVVDVENSAGYKVGKIKLDDSLFLFFDGSEYGEETN